MAGRDQLAALEPQRTHLTELLGDDAASTWLVGGVVRDALLGRPLLDVDLATGADPERVARRIAKVAGGTAFPLGERPGGERGLWRVATTTASGDDVQYDVCALRGGAIETDVAERDFAANALALPIAGDGVQVVDLHGGLEDIEHKRLRMVSSAALDDDPLRMLRAARIAHLLDWRIDDATVAAIRERSARAIEPAGERTFHELGLLLLHPEARRGWRLLETLGLDAVLLPELDACRDMRQSRFHHLDVHDHTLAVLDNCEDIVEATDFWLPLPAEPGLVRTPWSEDQRLVILLAALAHDLGKPATRTEREDGRVGFVGHDDVGRTIVDTLAERWKWSTHMRRSVGQLVGTHLALGFLLHTDRSLRERWRLRRHFGDVVPEAVVLSVGDRLATSGLDDRRRWVRAHMDLAREVWTDHWREVRDGIPEPLLDGTEIAAAAGIEPGPQLGELVTALAEAQAVREVATRDAASEFIRAFVADRA
ncbi:MAG: polynucleotide adenylyltransferase/metal dependent phosphohydrolase [Thermoleophilia bacterium]|nr:polynucleotide adenylyltransferase/metal dependent phosphohydrolase [Thermoleophilia bacterium]